MSGVEQDEERSGAGLKRKRKPSSGRSGKSKKQATGAKSKGKGGKDSRKPKAKDGPKRPAGAYLLFLKDFRRGFLEARPDVTVTSREIASAAGAAWRALAADLKQQYEARGDAEKAKYAAAKKAQAGGGSQSQLSDGASPVENEASELAGSEDPGADADDEEEEEPSRQAAEAAAADAAAARAASAVTAVAGRGSGVKRASSSALERPEIKTEEAPAAKKLKPKCAAVTAAAAAAAGAGGGSPRTAGASKRTAARPAAAAAVAAGQPRQLRASTPASLPPRPPPAASAATAGPGLMPQLLVGEPNALRRMPAAGSSTMLSDLAMPPAVPPPSAAAAGTTAAARAAGAAGAAGAVSPGPAISTSLTGFSSFVQECQAAFQLERGVYGGAVPLPQLVVQASQTWLLLHPWQRSQWAAKQALAHVCNPQLGMHDLLPGLDQYLVSLAVQALAQDGDSSVAGTAAGSTTGAAGTAAGSALPPAGGTFADLQHPPAAWAAGPAATPATAADAAAAGGSQEQRTDLSDKRCLLALLLASDAGPPPPLLSLDTTAREVRDVLAHMPQPPGTAPAASHAGMPAAAAAAAALAAAVAVPAASTAGLLGAALSMPAAMFGLPGASAGAAETALDTALFRFASAPAQQAGLGPGAEAAAGPERAPSPDILIWPAGSAHAQDPADQIWHV